MKHPERVEDYLEHMAEAIDRATVYLQQVDSNERVTLVERAPRSVETVARYTSAPPVPAQAISSSSSMG